MGRKKNEKTPIRPTLRGLEVGDTCIFPLSRISSVRASASILGLEWGKVFSTSVNREKRTLTVTRNK